MKVANSVVSVCFLFALSASNVFGLDVKPDQLVRDVVGKIMHLV